MDFQQRLEKAIQRGRDTRVSKDRARTARAMSEEEVRRLHSQYRIELSEHVEVNVSQLPDHFPGFQYATIVGEDGWGARVRRDDVGRSPGGGRDNFFSQLEMVVRPAGKYAVLDLAAKGTVRNKEVFHRNHFQKLGEVDMESFKELVDLWVLEFAELYAAKS